MAENFTCPRRFGDGTADENSPYVGSGQNLDYFSHGYGLVGQKSGCNYCGSMPPEDFMAAVRSGAKIGPTDKSYKLYVGDHDGKFYTQHLSEEQGFEFHQLWLDNKINWGHPGAPYVRLFLPGPSTLGKGDGDA